MTQIMMDEIRTKRLLLRKPTFADAEVIAGMIGRWEVVRWLTTPPYPYKIDDAEAFISEASSRPWFFVIEAHDLIGAVEINDHLGYWLGSAHWGKGYMTEAARALLARYFEETGADHVASGYLIGNTASCNTLTKLGFVETGRRMVFCRSRNAKIEHVDMRLEPSALRGA
ncbi:MAG: GNAT family N-acetyltransferase [Pseudomonadota bacterium]